MMSILKMFFLVVLQILAVSVPSGAQESFPVLEVSLVNNTLGFTQSVSIECRAEVDLSSTIATILSITIVHFNDDKSRFTEIASVSSFPGFWKNDDYGETMVAVGMIETIGVSYVNIALTNPKQENTGLYSCDLIGFGREGRITKVSASRKVYFISPTIEMAIQQIENYKKESYKLALTINSMATVLSQLQAEVTVLQNRSNIDSNKLRLLEEQTVHRLKQITNVSNAVRISQDTTIKSMSTVLSQLQAEVTLLQIRSPCDSNKLRLLEEQTEYRLELITNVTNIFRNTRKKFHHIWDESTIEKNNQQIENYKSESDKMTQTINTLVSNYNNSLSTALSQLQTEVTLLQNRGQVDSNKLRCLEEQTVPILEQITNLTSTFRNSQELTLDIINASKYEHFFASDYVNGRRYWLTKEVTFFSAAFAQTVCVFHGGYLAEIDSQDEFHFTRTFVKDLGSHFKQIVLGGTDEGHEGLWINRYSKTAVSSFWAPGQPDNFKGDQNCQAFWSLLDWFIDDTRCVDFGGNKYGFLCEIPE